MGTLNAERVLQMAQEHCAAWSEGRPEKIVELFSEDGSITVNGGAPHTGWDEIAANARGLLATFPGLVVHCRGTRHARDRAVFLWTLEGRHAETGNPVSLDGWHEWELDEDFKVKRCRGYFDTEDLERQIAGA